MITKTILQILGIVLFFVLIGIALTYPYDSFYHGSETVVLLEDSYEKPSLEALIGRQEFKGKVLYIRIWEPFDNEYKPYTKKELETFKNRMDSLRIDTDSDEIKRLSMKIEDGSQSISIEEQLDALKTVSEKYIDHDVAFVNIADPDNDFPNRKDDIRKWKRAVKKYKTPGYHMVINPKLRRPLKTLFGEITGNSYFPFYLLVDRRGNIVNYQAPFPQDTSLLYPLVNHLLDN